MGESVRTMLESGVRTVKTYEVLFYSRHPIVALDKVRLIRRADPNQYGGLVDAENPDDACGLINSHYSMPKIVRIWERKYGH